ncbi:uncharacterized protein [Dermacentor albipictus]|uniref:uncharacterized protein n=1 Tax=Dermacentor albipictus TaxID=60249 RepID=UPI0031FBE6FE
MDGSRARAAEVWPVFPAGTFGSGPAQQSTRYSGGAEERSRGSSGSAPKVEDPERSFASSPSSHTMNSGERRSSTMEHSQFSRIIHDARRPHAMRRNGKGGIKTRETRLQYKGTSNVAEQHRDSSRRSRDDRWQQCTAPDYDAPDSNSRVAQQQHMRCPEEALHDKRRMTSAIPNPRSTRRLRRNVHEANHSSDAASRLPVPVQRKHVSPRVQPSVPLEDMKSPSRTELNDRTDLVEKRTLDTSLEAKSSEKTLLKKTGVTSPPLFGRRAKQQKDAVLPRKSTLLMTKDAVSGLEGPINEWSVATPAEQHDRSVQPIPLKRSSLSPTAKPLCAPRSLSVQKPNQANDRQRQTKFSTAGENGLSAITDTPCFTAMTSLSPPDVAKPASLLLDSRAKTEATPSKAKRVLERPPNSFTVQEVPQLVNSTKDSAASKCTGQGNQPGGSVVPSWREKLKRRSTCCAPDVRHDESVNDSLRGTRFSSSEQKVLERSEIESREQPPVFPNKTSDVDLEKLKTHSENMNGATAPVTTWLKMANDAGETMPPKKLTKEPRAVGNAKTTALRDEGTRITSVITKVRDKDEKGGEKSRQGDLVADKRRSHPVTDDVSYTMAQKSSRSTAAKRSVQTGFESAGGNFGTLKVLLAGKQVVENLEVSVPNVDASTGAQKLPAVNDSAKDLEGTKATSEVLNGEKRDPSLRAKAVKILAEHTAISPSPLVSNEDSQEEAQSIKLDEGDMWLEECRFACEGASTVIALVLVVLILYGVARPMYVRDSDAQIIRLQSCHGEWCDRLGLWLLPNKSNPEKDPCENFYERVCYEWSMGRENTTFVRSVVDYAYNFVIGRISRSPMPSFIRNDLDQFVAFLKVCMSDPSFSDTVSGWMSLIRYELGDDYLVLRQWNWSRIMQAVIKKSLVYGLQTIVDVRVGRRPDKPDKAGLFLSVDGCIISLFSLNRSDTRAIMSLLREIIDELPEFQYVTDAAAQVKDIAFSIHQKRKEPVKKSMLCQNLESIARGVDTSTWLSEINQYVSANMSLENDCIVQTHETTDYRNLFPTLEEYPTEIRALYINVLMVGQVLRYRYSYVTHMLSKLHVCMHASRGAFRHLWVKLMMDAAGLQVQVRYLSNLFEGVKQEVIAHLERIEGSKVTKVAMVALINKTELRPISSAKIMNESLYRYPQLVVGYHMPQYFLQTLAAQAKRSVNQVMDEDSMIDFKGEAILKPTYNTDDLTISVPFLLLFPPVFYVYREEQFHNFATLGVLLALELVREAGRRSLLDLRAANENARCRIQRYLRLPGTGSVDPAQHDATEVFMWELAVRAALSSLENYTEQSMSSIEASSYGEQLKQVFFERFCMLSCALPGDDTTSGMKHCVLPLMNIAEFAVTYRCATKSSTRCGEM